MILSDILNNFSVTDSQKCMHKKQDYYVRQWNFSRTGSQACSLSVPLKRRVESHYFGIVSDHRTN